MLKRGFTLIELLVVISIISLLSSIVFTNLQTARAKARDNQRVQSLIQIRNAIELYHSQNGVYPDNKYALTPTGFRLDRNVTCFQCSSGGETHNHYDNRALTDSVGNFIAPNRPCDPTQPNNNSFGGCTRLAPTSSGNQVRGFFYKTNSNGTEYKIAIAETIENLNNVPQNMIDEKFNPGYSSDRTISAYSSEASKYWTWNCNFNSLNIGQPDCSRCTDFIDQPNFDDLNCTAF